MRYKISKHLFRSDTQYEALTKEQAIETIENLKNIRKNITSGNME